MVFCRVVLLVESIESPMVNAVIRPACLTVVGYAVLSRRVSSAVTCVRMIVHWAGERFWGQTGATIGDFVAPSSVYAA
jgi:hypothetical protein